MLLFPQKNEKTTGTDQIFYILTERRDIIDKLGQLLRLAGFSQVEAIASSVLQTTSLQLTSQARGVIIDVGDSANPQETILAIKTLVPRDIWCCVVGNQDAITLAQLYARQGLHYFYLGAQDDELIRIVTTGKTVSGFRWAVNISVLGCKGGVGNTSIAYQLVNKIIQIRQMPTLFIQGKAGSNDLDLLFDKKMNQELIPANKYLDLMCLQDETLPQLKYETTEKYNFVVYEETVNSAEKERIRQIVELSSCLIVVLDRSMSSVRVARQMIEINESINRSRRTPRRLLLCLSDSRPVSSEMLSQEDIQALIQRKIDIVFPWRKTRQRSSFFPLKSRISPADLLTRRVLGTSETPKHFNLLSKCKRIGGI
ncbi:hypothetical protein BTJ39_03190 [Izhakiella australiensis]|uniref:Tight adherance operon protein n=1 Tax=Izhakiella australiensis TaxID=1926881 RepID=A0A1S8YTJ7_9GAMM|nr:hypothetical protein BTJ39_03190 [Izhakiella australiensis]